MTALSRRDFFLGSLAVLSSSPSTGQTMSFDPDFMNAWSTFKQKFLTPEGRILDTANGNISHTEGQGWAMFSAMRANDMATFEKIFQWTQKTLKLPDSELHAWRYRPNVARPVDDPNPATDGELFIAASLYEAGKKWKKLSYSQTADRLTEEILARLVVESGPRLLLKPGLHGFDDQQEIVVNPSYYAFPVFRILAQNAPHPFWIKIVADGLDLLEKGRFGQWQLPPDWLGVDKNTQNLKPAAKRPARFSYDAVRVPLYLKWAGIEDVEAYKALQRYWTQYPYVPSYYDFQRREVSTAPAGTGPQEIARFIGASVAPATGPNAYYDAALMLLIHIAQQDRAASPF